MSNYRRSTTEGASYFFTVVTHQRRPLFDKENSISILREAHRREQQRRPFIIAAAVILPDHIHSLWTLPENDADYSSRWREIKKYVSKELGHSKNNRGESNVWQRRFWEHQIRDEQDWNMHMDYIHYNPVKHGYAAKPADWEWSSFSRWVARRVYTADWGSSEPIGLTGLTGLEFE